MSVRAPGVSWTSRRTGRERSGVHPGEQGHPAAQRLGEVELAPHRLGGDPGDLLLTAGVRREHLDHLALDQGRVHVQDDQPLGPAVQARRLDGHVDLGGGGLDRQRLAEQVGVDAGHVHLEGDHWIAGDPDDPVDVGAGVGDPPGDRRDRVRPQRPAENRDVTAAAAARPVVAGAVLGLDVHPEAPADLLHRLPQPAHVARRGHQDAEDQPATQDDLFDVEHLDRVPRQGVEHRGGDAGAVPAGEGDEQGGDRRRRRGHVGNVSGAPSATRGRRRASGSPSPSSPARWRPAEGSPCRPPRGPRG